MTEPGADNNRSVSLDAIVEQARRVSGWLGALAPLDHPDSPRAVQEGAALVEALVRLKKDERPVELAVAAEREACAKLADWWTTDQGVSPCHGEGNRFGQKVAGHGIAASIRARGAS